MASSGDPWPARVHRADEAQRQYGDLLERLVPYLEQGDPPADAAVAALAAVPGSERHGLVQAALGEGTFSASHGAMAVPESLAALIAAAREVPPWVDWRRIERAGAVFRRAGLIGGITLGLRSLVFGYAAPAGNKPLAFSGRLTEQADRRLAETGKFVTAVCTPGSLRPGGLGWRHCLEVRLIHAQVRRLLVQSGRWSHELWSVPINQHDMMATVLLFSNVFIDGLRMLGLHVTADEAEDYQHLWRWAGTLLGVESALLPCTHREATRLAEFVYLTQGEPDADSRALVEALLQGPRRRVAQNSQTGVEPASPRQRRRENLQRRLADAHVKAATSLCRTLVGPELGDALGLAPAHFPHLAAGLRSVMQALEGARRTSPRIEAAAAQLGLRYWEFSVSQGLGGMPAVYALPERLGRVMGR